MTVYVDAAKNDLGRMKMCHMLADNLEELLAMADKIGVARRHYQGFDKASCPHFDIAQSKRSLAVAAGAKEVDRYELVEVMRKIKAAARSAQENSWRHGWELQLSTPLGEE